MARLEKIDIALYGKLENGDQCYHIGEYTAHGTYKASETNQQIFNLKCKPTAAANRLYYKDAAIRFWGDRLAEVLNLEAIASSCTLVPAPCSKLVNDPEYDDRMLRVLNRLATHRQGLDIRPLLVTSRVRAAQHEGERLAVDELFQSMQVDTGRLAPPVRPTVLFFDDVFTMGGTFKAAQRHLMAIPGVNQVVGVFLARTVWPPPDFDAIFGSDFD